MLPVATYLTTAVAERADMRRIVGDDGRGGDGLLSASGRGLLGRRGSGGNSGSGRKVGSNKRR